jgi:hypothetical protein
MTGSIIASVPFVAPPAWAIVQRALLDAMNTAAGPFAAKYFRDSGAMRWDDARRERVRSDAFYEPLHNWPDAYALGGGEQLLQHASRSWEAITEQLTGYGLLTDEFDLELDWFHLGEGNLLFYGLCGASPSESRWVTRANRLADLVTGPPYYDPAHRTFQGPWLRPTRQAAHFGWAASMTGYGLPFHDIPGVTRYDDLKNSENAARMAAAISQRWYRSDGPQSLSATTAATMAYLVSGDDSYRRWVLDYVEAWAQRAAANGGLPPDNVGPSGAAGELIEGRWYGGHYGWTWPHGFYNIAMATVIGATNALLLSGDPSYLELPRRLLDRIVELGEQRDLKWSEMTLADHWQDRWLAFGGSPRTFVIPYRYGADGWFDYNPPALTYPTTLWAASGAAEDWARLEWLRERSNYDWNLVLPFRTKEEAGHEAPWLRFLAGDNAEYPELMLRTTMGLVQHRLDLMVADRVDLANLTTADFVLREGYDLKHHATGYNPVFTEALFQLTTGAPQRLYNSGLPLCRVTYADPQRGRPGLPPDVAALVTTLGEHSTTLQLVNLSGTEHRDVAIHAGGYGEHRIDSVRYDALDESVRYPGDTGYSLSVHPALATARRTHEVHDTESVLVGLPPGRTIELELGMRRFAARPTLRS